ncbi:MAG: sensor histidine kinase [Candidatus Xenobiia bacterium LiM19]
MEQIIGRIKAFLDSCPKTLILVMFYVVLFGIGYMDFRAGVDMSLSPLYLLPITALTWFVSPLHGIICALIGALLTLCGDVANGLPSERFVLLVWTIAVRLSFFIVIVILLTFLKNMGVRRRLADDALNKVKQRLELAQMAAGAGVWDRSFITGETEWSPQMFSLLGLEQQNVEADMDTMLSLVHPEDLDNLIARRKQAIEEHITIRNEYRVIWPNGQIHWLLSQGRGVYDEQGKPIRIIGICMDITERKKTEAELVEYREHLENLVEERTDELRKSNAQLHAEIERRDQAEKELKVYRDHLEELVKERTDELEKANRSLHMEIIERRHAELTVSSLLQEKEMLLKEVHHRIKNNMASMMGLLSLQIKDLDNPSAITSLQDAKSRLSSMGVMYDKLYCTENYREMSVLEYLPPLIREIVDQFPNREMITVETDMEDFVLSTRTVSSLGLIINELITNAMKYAFKERLKGIINVSASSDKGRATIVFEDDGSGIPESMDMEKSGGFGLKLVSMLIEQLDGSIRIERNNGSKFILEFAV